MENNTNKKPLSFGELLFVVFVVFALFFSGTLLGSLGGNRDTDAKKDTPTEDVAADATTQATTQPTTAPTTQPTTQAPAATNPADTADTTAAPVVDATQAPASGEMSKAEIIALFNESANKVKTEATKVVRTHEYKKMLEEYLEVPSVLNGMMDTFMGSVMKDDLEPQEYAGTDMIVEKYPVPRESWSSKLTEADVTEATCIDNGTEYEITLKLVETINPTVGSGVAAAMDTITEEDKEGIPDMVSKMDMRYFDCVIQCKIDKVSGRTTWSTYTTPVVFDCEVKMFGTHAVKMGLSFEKEYVITY